MIIEIKNNFLDVKISTKGAEMKSIKTADGMEQLHQPDKFWEDQSLVLFPICGAPALGKITVDGKDYPMPPHGFAPTAEFEISAQSENSVTFVLTSNDETKKAYPYDFEFYVTYALKDNSIDVCYNVVNKTDGTMYFSFGSHEGYNCPGGLANYEIHFEKAESKKPTIYETGLIPEDNLSECDGHSVLVLSDSLFDESVTVVYEAVDSNYVILKSKTASREIKVDYTGIENLFVWTEPGSEFVCIEPWCAMADYGKTHDDISNKQGIHALEKGANFERHHIITFN